MSYLNPPYANNFQELCAAMPIFYLEVDEMRAILRAQGRLLDGICDGIELVVEDNFILNADEATIRSWERAFGITYKERLTLDQRRHVVIGYICGTGHIGEPEIRNIIGQYTNRAVDVSFDKGNIGIVIEGEVFDEDNLLETLLRRIPAHLGLGITVTTRREFRSSLILEIGGAVGGFNRPHFAETSYSTTQDIVFRQGAAVGANRDGGDTPEVREELRTGFTLLQKARYIDEVGAGDTPDVSETARAGLTVAAGAMLEQKTTADTPAVKMASKGTEKGSGGLFCVTHIKSRLIE